VGGYELVALIFVHEVSDPLTSLVKDIDRRLEGVPTAYPGNKLGVFVVVCNEDEAAKQQARQMVAAAGFKHVVVGTTALGGPPKYRVRKDAEQTVVIYNREGRVVVNFALEKGELNDETAPDIVAAFGRVLRP
jgi:hypothetical protein